MDTLIELRFRNPPKTYKELMNAMEIIRDNYHGFESDEEIALFFYIFSGFTCKYERMIGNYHIYKGEITGVFKVDISSLSPRFPLQYEFNGEGLGIIPNVLISFQLNITPSVASFESLFDYIRKKSPMKYRKRSGIKKTLFDNYPVLVSLDKGEFSIAPKLLSQ